MLATTDAGHGPPLLLIHGSLCDRRYWAPQIAAFGARHHVIAVSLRRCWPETWDGHGDGYSIDEHVDDLVTFLEDLAAGPVDVVGHSRGGHVAFRLALRAPHLVRRLVLAEPGGWPDDSLSPGDDLGAARTLALVRDAAALIEAGETDRGLAHFVDGVSGVALWASMVPGFKRMARDNANTLGAQVRERRMAFTRNDLAAVTMPTFLVGGALTPDPFPRLLDLLEAHIPGARRVTIPGARHAMNLAAPGAFNAAVLDFLG